MMVLVQHAATELHSEDGSWCMVREEGGTEKDCA